MQALEDVVARLAEELAIPGVSVGVLHDGQEHFAGHGLTSVENPLPVHERTVFACGSTTKTLTGTAIMQLVSRGEVDLDAPARRYVPELRVADDEAAASVTVLQLLNHTAGWDGDFFKNTGEGDDALARYVDEMASLRQLTPPGEAISYNNASLAVAGRLIETVIGTTYEAALQELLLSPLGLQDSMFFPRDLLTRRYAVDHQRLQDGTTNVLPFGFQRAQNSLGGLATTARDLIRWARLHLEDGVTRDGTRLLDAEVVERMRQPTFEAPGWSPGDAVGISWLLSDPGGLRTVGHGGATPGQLSLFKTVPERNFALVAFTNCSPVGGAFNEQLMRWAWDELLGAPIAEASTAPLAPDQLEAYRGRYETVANIIDLYPDGGAFTLDVADRPEVLAELGVDLEQEPPVPFEFLADHPGRFICTTPPHKGATGFFVRDDETGEVTAINVFGRHAPRTASA